MLSGSGLVLSLFLELFVVESSVLFRWVSVACD